jgi:hypothetical protein
MSDAGANSVCFTNRQAGPFAFCRVEPRFKSAARALSSQRAVTGTVSRSGHLECHRPHRGAVVLMPRPQTLTERMPWRPFFPATGALLHFIQNPTLPTTPCKSRREQYRFNFFPCDAGTTAVSIRVRGTRQTDCLFCASLQTLLPCPLFLVCLTVTSCRSCSER